MHQTDCFELELPADYSKTLDQDEAIKSQAEGCFVGIGKQGGGGVLASQTKKPVDTSQISLAEYTQKSKVMGEKIVLSGKTSHHLLSRDEASLDGVDALRLTTESDVGGGQKMNMTHYIGVQQGRFFMIGWFYNSADSRAKADIEKSISSFRWK